jgi:hypothetical protein
MAFSGRSQGEEGREMKKTWIKISLAAAMAAMSLSGQAQTQREPEPKMANEASTPLAGRPFSLYDPETFGESQNPSYSGAEKTNKPAAEQACREIVEALRSLPGASEVRCWPSKSSMQLRAENHQLDSVDLSKFVIYGFLLSGAELAANPKTDVGSVVIGRASDSGRCVEMSAENTKKFAREAAAVAQEKTPNADGFIQEMSEGFHGISCAAPKIPSTGN